jgi:hypothetical protein
MHYAAQWGEFRSDMTNAGYYFHFIFYLAGRESILMQNIIGLKWLLAFKLTLEE